MIGQKLGSYEVLAKLGEGGMGEVYRATDTQLKRQVALKVLPADVANDTERLARFQREAEVLAALNHPHIAQIYGVERSSSTIALVMELVEGDDLSQRIAALHGRGLPLEEALPIAKQIAEALEAAHEQGIVHRDLKPANIKVRHDGTVKVLDFGLAKAFEKPGMPGGPGRPGQGAAPGRPGSPGHPGFPGLTNSPTLTSPALMTGVGVLLGTAAYMSPEQAKGNPADKRADIWAFGCVLFEMLTGRRAFSGDDVTDTIVSVLSKEPDWTLLPPHTPSSITKLLRRCLTKDRRDRLSDASDARLDIQDALSAPATEANAAPQPRAAGRTTTLPWALFAGALAALLLVGFAWAPWRRSSAPSAPPVVTRFPFILPEGQSLVRSGLNPIAISPDGTRLVYAADYHLYIRALADVEPHLIGMGDLLDLWTPAFSPDGQSIVFFSFKDNTLKRVAVTGGVAVTLCPARSPLGLSWGPDGILFGQGVDGIMRISPSGGAPERIVAVEPNEEAASPQMLPDGKTVLFTLAKISSDPARFDKAVIVAQTLLTGQRTVLVNGGSDARFVPTREGGGHLVYAVGGTLQAVPLGLEPLTALGAPLPVVEGVRRSFVNAHFSVSNNGVLVYLPGPASGLLATVRRDLGFVDRQGKLQPLGLPLDTYDFPRVSPDGRRIAVQTDDGKEAVVWTYELSGARPLKRLTFGGNNRFPMWSGDGSHIVFQSDREGDAGLWWQPADGSGAAERLTRAEAGTAHFPDSWPVKGTRFSFSVVKNLRSSLWTYSLPDKKAEPFGNVETGRMLNSAFSPDGRWLAYNLANTVVSSDFGATGAVGTTSIYVQPFPPTGARYQLTADGFNPVWSRDGKEVLYVVAPLAPMAAVPVTTEPSFAVGKAISIPRGGILGRAASTANYDMTPDGTRIIGTIDTNSAPRIDVVVNWFEELKTKAPLR